MRPEQHEARPLIDLRSMLDWLLAVVGRGPEISGLPAALAARTLPSDRGDRAHNG